MTVGRFVASGSGSKRCWVETSVGLNESLASEVALVFFRVTTQIPALGLRAPVAFFLLVTAQLFAALSDLMDTCYSAAWYLLAVFCREPQRTAC